MTNHELRKAIIPLAGKGTRLMPVTAAIPKALFPLADGAGRIKCVLHVILEHVLDAGIDQVALVVSPGQAEMLERYLDAARRMEGSSIPDRVTFIEQIHPRGFGDAVLCCAGFVGGESFVVLLGDHVQVPVKGAKPGVTQVTEAFDLRGGAAMIGMHEIPVSELSKVGVAKGEPLGGCVYRCVDFVEKPDLETATSRLETLGLGKGVFLGHCGVYAFTPEIFDCLEEETRHKSRVQGEVEMAAAQHRLLQRHPRDYYLLQIAGRACDMGTPEGYYRTVEAWRSVEW